MESTADDVHEEGVIQYLQDYVDALAIVADIERMHKEGSDASFVCDNPYYHPLLDKMEWVGGDPLDPKHWKALMREYVENVSHPTALSLDIER